MKILATIRFTYAKQYAKQLLSWEVGQNLWNGSHL